MKIKKIARIIVSALLISCMTLPTVACKGCSKETLNNEDDALVVATQELDEMFNPFFATSGYDTSVVGMTQISMLGSNKDGSVAVGDDVPTVIKDYNTIIVDQRTEQEKQETDPEKIKEIPTSRYNTTYNFVLKNGIKFSDGTDLTIEDVLFNLYIYLDPSYTGSSTLYSTDIVGLTAYRTQDPSDNNSETQEVIERAANTHAAERVNSLIAYFSEEGTDATGGVVRRINDSIIKNETTADARKRLKEDLETVRKSFREELYTDWNSVSASWEDYKEDYKTPTELVENSHKPDSVTSYENAGTEWVTEVWQLFLVQHNAGVDVEYDKDDSEVVISINYGDFPTLVANFESNPDPIRQELKNKMTDAEYKSFNEFAELKDYLVYLVFDNKVGGDSYTNSDGEISFPENVKNNIKQILEIWATATTARQIFMSDAISRYFKNQMAGRDGLIVPGAEGITWTDKDSGVTTFKSGTIENGVESNVVNKTYDTPHTVLTVQIKGIDPKAIWNFGFAVTPMAYYSNPDAANDISGDTGYTTAKDGYLAFDPEKGHYGFPFADANYFTTVIKSRLVPMGAGVYKASTARDSKDPIIEKKNGKWVENIEKKGINNGFLSNQTVYYLRNDYFHTTSETGAIPNAKINHFNYKVVPSNRLYEAVSTGDVMFADPAAQTTKVQTIQSDIDAGKPITRIDQLNNGYGYIGINAKYVRDIEVRRAIMYAMDTSLCTNFYGNLAEIIHRPMSKAMKWVYDNAEIPNTPYYSSWVNGKFNDEEAERNIKELVESAGYRKNSSGIYTRTDSKLGTLTLKFTFTIAGGETDHPAYSTISNAADILNKNGFKIKVVTDSQALAKLASGSLAVWAAAWSSPIDPDMYQTYHKDSKATSVLNWGYDEILGLNGVTSKGSEEEIDLINQLSTKIDFARSTTNQVTRALAYQEALDLVMRLAVELPTYQRYNIYVFDNSKIDKSTILMGDDISAFQAPLDKVWLVSFVGNN